MTKGSKLNSHVLAAPKSVPLPQENSRCPESQKSIRLPSVLFLTSQTSDLRPYVFCLLPPASCPLPPASCIPPSASSFYSSHFTRKAQRPRSAAQSRIRITQSSLA